MFLNQIFSSDADRVAQLKVQGVLNVGFWVSAGETLARRRAHCRAKKLMLVSLSYFNFRLTGWAGSAVTFTLAGSLACSPNEALIS